MSAKNAFATFHHVRVASDQPPRNEKKDWRNIPGGVAFGELHEDYIPPFVVWNRVLCMDFMIFV
jgi:hypothetical protein